MPAVLEIPHPIDDTSARACLLVRIRDTQDTTAWSQFNGIYRPLIFRFARRHGFQGSDAADLTQEVMREVSRTIGNFDDDQELGRFRGWLLTIARCTVAQMRRARSRNAYGTGDSAMLRQLENIPDESTGIEHVWNQEFERRLFEWAAEQVRDQVDETTWEAFHRTAVNGQKPAGVARELHVSIGSVYVARNRVLNRIQKLIREIDDQ